MLTIAQRLSLLACSAIKHTLESNSIALLNKANHSQMQAKKNLQTLFKNQPKTDYTAIRRKHRFLLIANTKKIVSSCIKSLK
jgi:hypothetical protein